MTHRGPFQPLLFCDSVILRQGGEGVGEPEKGLQPGASALVHQVRTGDTAMSTTSPDGIPSTARAGWEMSAVPIPVLQRAPALFPGRSAQAAGWLLDAVKSWGRQGKQVPAVPLPGCCCCSLTQGSHQNAERPLLLAGLQ